MTVEQIYPGDIFEIGVLHSWPEYHSDVLRILVEKAQNGAALIFVPGNHDSVFRNHTGQYGNIEISRRATHRGANGKFLMVTHGDETDTADLTLCCGF